jgi:hypothetical protein
MRLLVPIVATVTLAAAGLAAGCARSTDGVARANPAHASQLLPSDQLDTVLLTPSQLSDIVGARLQPRVELTRPVPGSAGAAQCAAVDTAGAQGFVGDNFSAFHLLVSADGTGNDNNHVVAQAASIYPDGASATKAFAAATNGLPSCNGKEVRGAADWKFAINDATADTVRWNKEQTNLPQLWVCYGQARVRDNVIIQAMACQGDDGGQANADAILNHMSATVWELGG